ncbi:MAG: 4Fe-4S dicluster domain-containing protein [Ruminococcaceae bacterium]|nr:4Fe-4S dicluster domain-containing protein [Oscillospiraceae bacterium]
MKRKIITIDADKCNGCGLCAAACHEGAIGMRGGKAVLLRDDYCDGLGDCLPVCPTGAICFEEREAAAYDEAAVKANMAKAGKQAPPQGGCPGSMARSLGAKPPAGGCPGSRAQALGATTPVDTAAQNSPTAPTEAPQSRLAQWPVQIKLVPVNAPYFDGARLLIAADCAAYAHAGFHERFMKNHVTLIGCPKLDEGDYADKLAEILRQNDIKSVTVVRMEVPCCGGLEQAVKTALQNSGKMIPWQVETLALNGEVLDA